jgi:hypothetical protein
LEKNVLHRLSFFAVSTIFAAASLHASTYSVSLGELTATGLLSDSGWSFDVRGLAAISVSTGGSPVGQFLITDDTGGTDPDFQTLAFGNSELIDIANGDTTNGPFADTYFDFSSAVVSGNTLVMNAYTLNETASDPGLDAFVADNPTSFTFGLTGVEQLSSTELEAQWLLESITAQTVSGTPEPATFILAAFALALAVTCRKFSIAPRL